jgi:hypothetical protein
VISFTVRQLSLQVRNHLFSLYMRLGEPQIQSGGYGEKTNLLPLPVIETRFLRRPARNVGAIPTVSIERIWGSWSVHISLRRERRRVPLNSAVNFRWSWEHNILWPAERLFSSRYLLANRRCEMYCYRERMWVYCVGDKWSCSLCALAKTACAVPHVLRCRGGRAIA